MLADRQHGVVSYVDLLAAGLTHEAIQRRLASRRLAPVHAGVYAAGHRHLRPEGFWLAAVKGVGEGAVLSHAHAAALWELRPAPEGRIHVTTPNRNGNRHVTGVVVHRVRSLPGRETTTHRGISVTTPARTLLDLAATLRPRHLEQCVERADRLDLFDLGDVRTVIAAHPRRHGTPALRGLIERLHGAGPAFTRSELEVRLLELCDAHELPRPRSNTIINGNEVDFHWPGTPLIAETDGWAHHRMPDQRERDHAKRLALQAAGYSVIALTWRQVTETPELTAASLRRLLSPSGAF